MKTKVLKYDSRKGESKMNKKGGFLEFFGILFVAIIFAAFFTYGITYALTIGEENIIVKEKWTKFSGDDAKYLISSKNGQVFEISDSLIKMRFDSSNLYSNIESGQSCKIKTQGWRFGFFSDYKNILEADCDAAENLLEAVE